MKMDDMDKNKKCWAAINFINIGYYEKT